MQDVMISPAEVMCVKCMYDNMNHYMIECVCVCVHACTRACVRATCLRGCMCVRVWCVRVRMRAYLCVCHIMSVCVRLCDCVSVYT
jgi:hypothetical protein